MRARSDSDTCSHADKWTKIGTEMSANTNLLPAAEIKRRGIAAIEERLERGPVHLVKRNRAVAVVLSEREYARLQEAARSQSVGGAGTSAWEWILSMPAQGSRTRAEIDAELEAERRSWGDE